MIMFVREDDFGTDWKNDKIVEQKLLKHIRRDRRTGIHRRESARTRYVATWMDCTGHLLSSITRPRPRSWHHMSAQEGPIPKSSLTEIYSRFCPPEFCVAEVLSTHRSTLVTKGASLHLSSRAKNNLLVGGSQTAVLMAHDSREEEKRVEAEIWSELHVDGGLLEMILARLPVPKLLQFLRGIYETFPLFANSGYLSFILRIFLVLHPLAFELGDRHQVETCLSIYRWHLIRASWPLQMMQVCCLCYDCTLLERM